MWIPKTLYELMPAIYLIVGILAAAGFDPKYGRAAGIMLAVAAIIIWRMRRKYRADGGASA